MKILVTGADGFCASRILDYYQSRFAIEGKTHSELDFTHLHSVLQCFEQEMPAIVVHCGAVSDTGYCETNPSASWLINVIGAENIAIACALHHIKLIFFSTDQIYFGTPVPIEYCHTEEEPVFPSRVYGQHKLEAEKRCLAANSDTVCLRLSWMYDKKARCSTEHGSFLQSILNSIRTCTPISFPIHDYRSITNVWEVIKNLEKAFALPAGIYNFGSENHLSSYETASYIFSLLNEAPHLLQPNQTAFQDAPRNMKMNIDKISHYGISFLTTKEGLKAFL